MSVGGDGKDKHDQEPDHVDADESAAAAESSVPDVAPYDAPTEVIRAIDPNAPAPGEQVAQQPAVSEPAVSEPEADAPPTEAFAAEEQPAPEQQPAPEEHPAPEVPSAPTVAQPAVAAPESGEPASRTDVSNRAKIAVVAGAAIAILGVFYTADMLSSSGSVPRGVTVAGISIGGLSHDDAEARLQSELGPRVEQPVRVAAGDQELELVPAAAGLDVDWTATLDQAGAQPINPFTRLTSLFADREIGVQSSVDEPALDAAVESLRAQTDRQPSEGDVVFEGTTPVAVTPAPGQTMNVADARDVIEQNWAFGSVELPVDTVDVTVHQDEVDRVLRDVATPAVSAPVVFTGRDGANAVLAPDAIAGLVSFEPDGNGALAEMYDAGAATRILAPQLASTETQPKDASFALGGGAPTVVPGVVGELVQWPKTLEQLPTLLSSTDSRTTEAVYEQAQPALTTEGAQALGINEVVGEYTTGGFEYASGVNIRLTADIVNGALVKPGETFSLNDYTGPRGSAQGFVESGIIDNGRPDRAVGGGISQFATTLYNASYFGGMEDAGHTEHSYYISRYPEAREATVFEGAIDLKFTNPAKTGVLIESFGTSSNVTVRLWGTKTVDVESITGSRTNPTSPNTITLPAGDACVPSSGGPGFTASDTRVITDIASGNEVSRNTRTVKYDPIPIVRCQSPEPEPEPEAPAGETPPGETPANQPTPAAPPAATPPADDGE
ncbi:VanW family protein [Rhodococcoides kyotonense]|uniref:Vancomycin resistance protein YoaR, contains peptidoglycan-binding and VanW domains n=1 Tax=Rhodococcoides kyotonense TaxID=398843 RepID=A0A239JAD2_9NOCA|nr:VanW family protein [Rhodococcus kyotonensis]SNT02765.1 Vancomycin resistance protein YoaR, contains peptidoglycan-binding and VanW domains [Rhodococcus kyotonensis]